MAFSTYLTVVSGQASAQPADIKGHWAEKELGEWHDKGLIQGYSDGSLQPDNAITRAELMALINRYYKLTASASIQFTDVTAEQWQYEQISKAVAAGYVDGYSDGSIRPDQPVSRQESAVMLSKLLKLDKASEDALKNIKDAASIADWSKGAVSAMVAKGVIEGYEDGTFRPAGKLTRAETVVLLGRAPSLQTVSHDKAGTFGPASGTETVNGDVAVNVSGVTLQNTVIQGNLLLGKGIGNGDVTLKNVKVAGTVTVNGGGENSIHLVDTVLIKVVVDKETGVVRLVAQGNTSVQETYVQSSVKLEESSLTGAGFIDVIFAKALSAGSSVQLIGSFNSLHVLASGTKIEISKGSIGKVTVDGSDTTVAVNNDASIVSLVLNALAKITGYGSVENATVNEGGKGSSFEKAPVKVDGPQKGSITIGLPIGGGWGGSGGSSGSGSTETAKKVIAYVPGWKNWSASNPIDAAKLTHINYAFTHVKDNKIVSLPAQNDDANYAYLQSLKKDNPKLKILPSVGGWGADGFSDAALTESARNTFADSIIEYIKKYKLDGVDLDWEYPTQTAGGIVVGRPDDKQNFTLMLQTIREKLNALGSEDGKYYELTIAAGAGAGYLAGVEIDKITPLLDNINLMTYDFAGAWVQTAEHHTNLYGAGLSVDEAVKLLQKNNVPSSKIVIGGAFYSHLWTDVEAAGGKIVGQKAVGNGATPTYDEIISNYNEASGYKRYWDSEAKAPYLYNEQMKVFLSYDDPQSLHEKGSYVLNQKLGGAMFWEYSQDQTGALLDALAKGVQGKTLNPDTTTVPAAPAVTGVSEGQTYKTGVLPNWKDAAGTASGATLNGAAYTKGTGITEAGEYTLVVTAAHGKSGKTASTTVKFKVDPQTKVIAYVGGWKNWSEAKPVDASKLTHINYAFTHIKDNKIVPIEVQNDDANYAYLHSLKAQNADLKTLISVGGWAADGFSDAALTEASRQTFTDSIIDYVKKYNLDGVDLDWEYPTQKAGDTKGRPEDKQNFTTLLQLMRDKLNALGLETNRYYELTIAAGAGSGYLAGVEIEKITPLLDNINLMTYDFSGGWVPQTEHHTNLFGSGNNSVDQSVQLFKNNKVPANKIVIGAAFYSHLWTNVESSANNGLGQKAAGTNATPTYSVTLATYNESNGYTRYWDQNAKAPYLYNAQTGIFISFDDPESMAEKAAYTLKEKLGGAMFWEYSQDETGALLDALVNGLKGNPYTPDTTSVPAKPQITNVTEGETYTTGVLPNWTDAPGTVGVATLNGEEYIKGTGITEAGDYTLVVTAVHGKSGKTASTTVKFKVDPRKKVIAYIAGWEDWSVTNSVYANKLTHLNYSFTLVKDNKIITRPEQKDDQNYQYIHSLKAQNPNLKVLFAVGGWGADGFSDAVLTNEARDTFTNSIINYIKKYKLDGVDIDWEYPTIDATGEMTARKEDKHNYTLFLQMLRDKLNQLGLADNKYYELSMAAGAGPSHLKALEAEEISKYLDNFNIMTYDYSGGWVQKTEHHTNVYGPGLSMETVVKRFIDAKVPANKIVVGIAFYSHLWTDVQSTANNGLGQAATGSGNTPTYNEILEKYNAANGYVRYWDDAAKAPYLFNGSTWLSYDDPESITAKAQFVQDQGLGGAMFWEYSMDKSGALLDALIQVIPVK
ncbi:glycosyl hydrolase family 18 protein [Paenibacillus chitinolyticus]|uniref:glycosyl hydrolase family 18 protein n=1 Tax=Paenibacillus chitinolyticus TaxID=79263 RepID=UPI0036D8272D